MEDYHNDAELPILQESGHLKKRMQHGERLNEEVLLTIGRNLFCLQLRPTTNIHLDCL